MSPPVPPPGGCCWVGVRLYPPGMSEVTRVPPGWYPDPQSGNLLRWWDGVQWGGFAPPAPVVAVTPKDMTVAYVLAVFLGGFGAHQFYLRNTGVAVTQLLLTLIGAATAWLIVGGFLLFAVLVWVIVDLFLIPGWVRRANGLQA